MQSKNVKYNVEARDALKRGVDILANAVKVTLGPKGRNVIIYTGNASPVITKDGVTVAREINLKDPLENTGAQLVKEVASMTADVAGDGTTTATVLAQAIATAGLKNVTAGANPMDLKRGIDKAVAAVIAHIKEQSQQVGDDNDKIMHIASISANNDESIGSLIAGAMKQVGNDGIISVQEATSTETKVVVVEGMQFGRGYISPQFVNTPNKRSVEFTNAQVLLYDKKITSMAPLLPVLELQVKAQKPLLIICEEMDGEALATMIVNKMRGSLNIAVVRTPGFAEYRKEILEDIGLLTGATYISEDFGYRLEDAELEDIGNVDKIIVTKDSTTLIGSQGNKQKLKLRIEEIKENIKIAANDRERMILQERLAKLSGGVAILYIGAATEVEMKEKKDRVDDALHATRAAIEEGIVPGGGVAYIRAITALNNLKGDNDDQTTGIAIIRSALEEPLRQICENAGAETAMIMQRVKKSKGDLGYNARTGKFENLVAGGVIDPTKVVRIALENAASIASLLLTTECVLYDDDHARDMNFLPSNFNINQ